MQTQEDTIKNSEISQDIIIQPQDLNQDQLQVKVEKPKFLCKQGCNLLTKLITSKNSALKSKPSLIDKSKRSFQILNLTSIFDTLQQRLQENASKQKMLCVRTGNGSVIRIIQGGNSGIFNKIQSLLQEKNQVNEPKTQ